MRTLPDFMSKALEQNLVCGPTDGFQCLSFSMNHSALPSSLAAAEAYLVCAGVTY